MRYLLLSVLVVCVVGVMVPSAFAEITISDDATGGDCSSVGTWDSASRTCTFTSDVSEQVTVGSNYITLDGNGHTIDIGATSYNEVCSGSDFTDGVSVETKTNVVIKNFTIKNSCYGVYFSNAYDSSILDNTLSGNYYAGILASGDDITISGNTVTGSGLSSGNGNYGINVSFSSGGGLIENNNVSNTIWGITSHDEYPVLIKNNIIDSASSYGIYIFSKSNDIEGNTVTNSGVGIYVVRNNHKVYDNVVSNNNIGIECNSANVYSSSGGHEIFENTISNSQQTGLIGCYYAKIYHNNILNSVVSDGASVSTTSLNSNSGNYWSDYSPHCDDTNYDNRCDDPYPFFSSNDGANVWTIQDGWLTQITDPGDIILEAADSSGAVGTFSVTATHDGSSMSVTCDTASGITFPIGTTTILCTAQNSIKSTFTVTTNLETTPPVVTVPADITLISPDNSGLSATFDVTASDNYAVTVGPTCSAESGSTFPIGVTTVTCTASDAAGNVGTGTFTVTNNLEDVSPVVTVPADMTFNLLESETEATVEFSVSATDNIAVTVGPTCTVESGSTFQIGSTTVTCTAADAAGNVGTSTFVVMVIEYDSTPPTVTVPSDITVYEIASNVGAVATFSVSATDNVAVTVDPTCSPISGATFTVGDNTVTCTAEDANGNVGTSTFVITVVEYTPPSLVASNARILDASANNTISEVSVNQQVQIAVDVTNEQNVDQPFVHWVEVTGAASDSLWVMRHLTIGESTTAAVPWTPPLAGDYTLTIKVVDKYPDLEWNLLSTPLTLQINVPAPDLPTSATVYNAVGSSTPGCEPNCFSPSTVTIAGGGEVTWINNDTAAHTSTSGSATDGPTGVFDSSLIMAGSQFSHVFNSAGVYPYFCMVHPWMTGTILVGSSAELPDEPEPPAELSISISKSEYNLNEIITVTTSLDNISQPYQVTVEVSDPEGVPVVTRALSVSPNVSSSMNFKVSENSLTGNYKIVASAIVDGNITTDTIYFKIKSQYNQFQIASVQVTDQQGNPSILTKGDMAYIKVTLTSGISIEPLVTVNLFDSDLTTLGVGSVRTNIGEGESEIILSFLIPDDAALGNADIFVNAFTNWVSSGGIPLTPEVSISEEITQ